MSQISDSLGGAGVTAQPSRFSEMSSEDFIQIIFTELTNQDPLEPNDTSALLEQLNSIRSIESDIELTNKLEALVTENQISSAANMIGKFIGGLTDDAQRVAGYVVSAIRQGDEISLELDNGWFVKAENVETIIDPSIFEDPPPGVGDEGDENDDPPGDDPNEGG